MFAQVGAVGVDRQGYIHAVINDEERVVRAGSLSKGKGARIQIAVAAVFFA